MKLSATTLLLTAALGVSAHPSGHVHRHLHRSVDGGSKFYKSSKPNGLHVGKPQLMNADSHVAGPDSPPAPSYEAPAPAYTPPKPPPAPKHEEPHPSGSGHGQDNGQGINEPEDLCQGGKQKRATLAEIIESGNTGGTGAEFGCNIKMVSSSLVEKYPKKYPYTIKLNNVGGQEQECACFLKKGKDGQPNSGSFKNQELFKFKLAANKYQYVAAARDSKLTCTCGPNDLQCNKVGQWGGTWVESDFASGTNSKAQAGEFWSGADASAITASMSQLDIPGIRVYREGSPDQASIVCPKGGPNSKNAYLCAGDVSKDGVGLNIRTQGDEPVRIVADIDYQHGC